MDVENLPDNLEGKESTDNSDLKPKSSVQLSDRQKQLLQKKIEKQKKFLDGDIKKKKLTKKDISNVQAVQDSGRNLCRTGITTRLLWNSFKGY